MAHPEVRDVCDIGRILFGNSQFGYNFTAVMFILNNTFIQGALVPSSYCPSIRSLLSGLHCLVGAKLLNTLSNSSRCTIVFSAIAAIMCFFFSLPRTLKELSWLGVFSAVTMGIAVLLAIIFSGVQSEPFGFTGEAPLVTTIPVKGTSSFRKINSNEVLNDVKRDFLRCGYVV
jgi:hypothetical protein